MVNSIISHTYDLETPLVITPLRHALATGDQLGDRFDITVTQKGQPADLTGAGVTGYFIRTADGATVIVTGSASGNVASVTLPESCYAVPGRFTLTVKVSKGDVRHAVYVGEGAVLRSSTDTIIDPGHEIPDLDELLAKIAEIESAISAANTATTKANDAASAANTAAGKANTATSAANTAKTNADAATKAANDAASAANTAKTNADTAAKSANDAAASVNTAKTNAEKAATAANEAASAANASKTAADTAASAANTAKSNADAATKKANDAAASATTSAGNANSAATAANDAASAANTAKSNADKATTAANNAASAANTAKTAADTAAANANAKADYIGKATFTAHNVAPGGTATVTKTDKDGHAHFDFGLVKGDPGDIAGNAPSADKLLHARQINRVEFDGTKNISIPRIVANDIPEENSLDLNTLLLWENGNSDNRNTIEYYTSRTGTSANKVQNKPVDTDNGFLLTVSLIRCVSTSAIIMQEYVSTSYRRTYRRFYISDSQKWTEWECSVSSVWGALPDDTGDVKPQVGRRNLLRGTEIPKVGNGSWESASWFQRSGGTGQLSEKMFDDFLDLNPVHGLEIHCTADNIDAVQMDIPVMPNTDYILSYYVKATYGTPCLMTRSYKLSSGYSQIFAEDAYDISSTWTKHVCAIRTPSDATRISVQIGIRGANGTGTINICRMQLTEGNIPTDWLPAPEDFLQAVDIGGTNLLTGTDGRHILQTLDSGTWEDGSWSRYGSAVNTFTVEPANGAFGLGVQRYFSITALSTGTAFGISQRNIPFKAGDTFTFSVDIATDASVIDFVFRTSPYYAVPTTSSTVKAINKDGYVTYVFSYTIKPEDVANGTGMFGIKTDRDRSGGTYLHIARIKMERGVIPTDWSPAPEDKQDKIDYIGGTQILRGTNPPAIHTTGGWLTSQWIPTHAAGAYTPAVAVTLSDPPSPNITKGVSLTNPDGLTSWNGFKQKNIQRIQTGMTLTLSCWARLTKGSGDVQLQFDIDTDNHIPVYYPVSQEWKKYSYTIEIPQIIKDFDVSFFLIHSKGETTLEICGMKLEHGSVPTDWSPAPEDVVQTGQLTSLVEGILRNHGLIN